MAIYWCDVQKEGWTAPSSCIALRFEALPLFSSNSASYSYSYGYVRCTRWNSRLRHCATSLKVAGSIPDGAIGIFHWHKPSGRTMALGSNQPLTQMSTRNISWGSKGGRCVGLTNLPYSCADCLEIWKPQPVHDCTEIDLPFYLYVSQVTVTAKNSLSLSSSSGV
jgi:hypothetical protein